MVQGTGSGVGKSVLVSALCRIFLQDGYSVAPFKSQNMALNSYVTETGQEMGRAQATQAFSAKIKPSTDMNPILIKPTADTSAQIILQGKPVGNMSVYEYKQYKKLVFPSIKSSFRRLCREYELIVIEGAGSPAEINLKKHDLANMKIARLAQSPVILVGDIDKGGVFAWLAGTLQLLTREERNMIKGIIINKFRGDLRLLLPGIRFLEKYTGIKVLGVIPYFKNIKIPEEDSVPLEEKIKTAWSKKKIKIDVIYLPHISNFTDFDALEQEPDVQLKYVREPDELDNPDVIIIPGTKNTIHDLAYLKRCGLARKIMALYQSLSRPMLIGMCGGYQMLGEKIYDREGIESKKKEITGLGILAADTYFAREKILSQIKARELDSGIAVIGYEIHHGRTMLKKRTRPVFKAENKKRKYFDGAITEDGRCWGTYFHGIFDNDTLRRNFLNKIRRKKGLPVIKKESKYNPDMEFNKLARLVRSNINMDLLYKILSGEL